MQTLDPIPSIWKRFGLEDVTSLANGFTMFRFKTEDELQKVIENGPWMFGGKSYYSSEMAFWPSADKQGNSDASPSHQVKDAKQLNGDASTSHQGKGKAITSRDTKQIEMSSEESDSSGETDTDCSDETDSDESASLIP
uniref:DUF4283 domain-containing protein n=1 Tax=Populus alba TaxID=43335 RepID=A0A4U5Q9D5_POPAL|nr:hypothetical protein D5086_0000121600 [Populus alba]